MFAFCHIPKTAGTSLNFILRKNFGAKLIPTIPRDGINYNYNDLKLDMRIYKDAKCLSGHELKPFINYKEFDDEIKWFTFLRDPVKRFVSQYIHQRTNGIEKYNLPIEEWAEKYSRSNWLVKWIAGKEDLDQAIEIINKKFVFIGLVEDFDKSLEMMKEVFSMDLDIGYGSPKMVVRDKGLKDELLKDRYQELLPFYLEQNKLDIQLYDYVKNNFYSKKNVGVSLTNKKANPKIEYFKFRLKQNFLYKPYAYFTK